MFPGKGNHMIHGVIFDLGSTLLYTDVDGQWDTIVPRMNADLLTSLQAQGSALHGETFIRRFADNFAAMDRKRQVDQLEGTTAQVLAQTLAELGAPALSPAAQAQALRAYYAYSESLWQPVPGVYDLLPQLLAAGYKLAMISNASDTGNVDRLVDGAKLRGYFNPIIVSSSVGIRKPAPKIFDLVLEPWGLPANECVMVGDTLDADILGARLAGLHNVWLSTYADRPSNRAQRSEITPEAEITALGELPRLLSAW
jgi:HAD superfamily hydrolase (TIGR01549 family)